MWKFHKFTHVHFLGELYTWGCGEYGRLGHSDNVTQLRPKQVKALAGQRVIQVACGKFTHFIEKTIDAPHSAEI